jgi:multisubunit Na+/H+ antiporter MnhB subunit
MKFDIGIVVLGITLVLFYLRLAVLRGKKRRERREQQLAAMKGGKGAKIQLPDPNKPYYQVSNWWLLAISMILILVGMAAKTTTGFPELIQQYWWVVTSFGVLLFAFCFK